MGIAGTLGNITDSYEGLGTEGAGNHGHNVGIGLSGTGIGIYAAATGITIKSVVTGITLSNSGGAEARPRNCAYLACIKY
jgi:hypothetical protein